MFHKHHEAEQAILAIVLEQVELWRSLARSFGLDFDEAKDVVQKALIEFWRHCLEKPEDANEENFKARLRQRAIDFLRWRKRNPLAYQPEDGDLNEEADDCNKKTDPTVDPQMTPADYVDRADMILAMRAALESALGKLPALQAQVLRLAELEGLSMVEIAGQLEISVSNAKVSAYRARQTLRQDLKLKSLL